MLAFLGGRRLLPTQLTSKASPSQVLLDINQRPPLQFFCEVVLALPKERNKDAGYIGTKLILMK